MTPCIAIIDSNTLSGMALRSVLCNMYPYMDVVSYTNMDDYIRDSHRNFLQFFVSQDILFANSDEFEYLKDKTIALTTGLNPILDQSGYRMLDISQDEDTLLGKLMLINQIGDVSARRQEKDATDSLVKSLSARERDVLALIVKGHINKEISTMLDISLTTVIFHRNNICRKLKTRSVGRLTVLAVLSGVVDLNDI